MLAGATAEVATVAPLVAAPGAPKRVPNAVVEAETVGAEVAAVLAPGVAVTPAPVGVVLVPVPVPVTVVPAPEGTELAVGVPGAVAPGVAAPGTAVEPVVEPEVDPTPVLVVGVVVVVVVGAFVGTVVVTHGTSVPFQTQSPGLMPPCEIKSSCSRVGESMYSRGGMRYASGAAKAW